MTLREAIIQFQNVGKENGFEVIIVGGAMVRLIGPKTKIDKVDTDKRIIVLKNAENPGVIRSEEDKTTIDIDAVAFYTEEDPFTKEAKGKSLGLLKALQKLQHDNKDFPTISVEPVFYHPPFALPNSLIQFVSSIEQYEGDTHHFLFRLGAVTQTVSQESLARWEIQFEENPAESILTLSPLAIQRRYAIRGFSKKPKDIEKIWGEKSFFAAYVDQFNKKTKGKYEVYYAEWDEFEKKVNSSKDLTMQIKRNAWNAYWKSIGTYLAHGTGLIGKLLLPLGNTFFAGK